MSRAQQKDTAIIQAATQLFTERGLDKVSVDDIAKAAKVSKPTIYSRYKTKEKLYVAMLIAECEKQVDRMFELRHPSQPMAEYVFDIIHTYLRFIVEQKQTNLFKNAIFYAEQFAEIGEAFMQNGPLQGRQKLANALQAELDSGNLNMNDPLIAADFILSRCKGIAFFTALLALKHVDIDAQIRQEADTITNEFLRLYSSPTG